MNFNVVICSGIAKRILNDIPSCVTLKHED